MLIGPAFRFVEYIAVIPAGPFLARGHNAGEMKPRRLRDGLLESGQSRAQPPM